MKKFFLIPLMTLVCSVMAWADPVTTLEELQAALNAGGEITLGADIDLEETGVTFSSGTATLNLGEFTLTSTKEESYSIAGHNVLGGGTLKVSGGSLAINAGSLGAIENTAGNAVFVTGGSLVIEGGIITGANEGIFHTSGSLTINGGVFFGPDNAIWAGGSNASLTINGGDFTGDWCAVQSDNGASMTITAGSFTGHDYDLALGAFAIADASCSISGGEFRGKGIHVYTAGGTLSVTGGSFAASPAAYVDYSAYVVTKPESLYIVAAPAADVVAFNKNKIATYESLAAAIEAASTGDVLYLYKDDETAATLSKFLTINTNGHAVNLSAGEGYALILSENTYTLNGVAVIGTNHYTSVAAAVEAASKGDVINLWADAPAVTVSKTIIVNANGFNASAITAGEGYSRAATNDGYVFGNVSLSKSGNVYTVSNFDELFFAINGADAGDEIQLANDIAYPAAQKKGYVLNIAKSITLNGQGHSLTGYGTRSNGGRCALVINDGEYSTIDVVIKNITIEKSNTYPISVRGKVHSLTIDNAVIDITNRIYKESYSQGITIGGEVVDADNTVTIKNSTINQGHEYYPVIFWVPVKHFNIENSTVSGWCSLYFKPGSNGTVVNAQNCIFSAQNHYSGTSNAYGAFVLEDDGINISLDNSTVDCTAFGDQTQTMFLLSSWIGEPAFDACSMTITGDNSQIIGHFFQNDWTGAAPVQFTIMGGTYYDEDITVALPYITIPDEYEKRAFTVTNNGVQTTLWRVRKKITTSYSINQDVEGQGAGQNEHTEFLISGDETVAANSTVANYVEVSNDATLTLPAGKKLEVTNGLDVTDGATLDVAAGSTLVVGEGGVTSESTESIVIESNENGSASFLLSPEVIVNTTPNLTVKMTVKGKGYKNETAGKTYYWHRFAAPVVMAEEWSKAPDYGTWLYGWDYTADGGKGAWAELPTSMAMVPFQGYTLSPEHLVENENEEIVYSFKGQLAGNQNMNLQFNARGFNFFGNSYTGYIDVLTLVDQLMANANIDGTVYMWNNGEQGYEPVSLQDLKENPDHYDESWQKEIAPMQTFILRQINTGEDVSTLLNYENSIWKNPRYGNVPAPAPAPKRATADADPFVRVMITAANGQNSQMSFAENADRSDDFEKGYDALKYMNENSINVYSTLDGQDLANVATNDLEGKTITLQTNDEIAYTMSFLVAEGEQYAIRDNATGKVIAIEDGATYEFAAQPNSTVEGRFEIVSVAKVPTAIENAEVKANVKGIYTLTGQYVGEDFEVVPAGVYVVNGVKIVK